MFTTLCIKSTPGDNPSESCLVQAEAPLQTQRTSFFGLLSKRSQQATMAPVTSPASVRALTSSNAIHNMWDRFRPDTCPSFRCFCLMRASQVEISQDVSGWLLLQASTSAGSVSSVTSAHRRSHAMGSITFASPHDSRTLPISTAVRYPAPPKTLSFLALQGAGSQILITQSRDQDLTCEHLRPLVSSLSVSRSMGSCVVVLHGVGTWITWNDSMCDVQAHILLCGQPRSRRPCEQPPPAAVHQPPQPALR